MRAKEEIRKKVAELEINLENIKATDDSVEANKKYWAEREVMTAKIIALQWVLVNDHSDTFDLQ